jgi:hypothetical protein
MPNCSAQWHGVLDRLSLGLQPSQFRISSVFDKTEKLSKFCQVVFSLIFLRIIEGKKYVTFRNNWTELVIYFIKKYFSSKFHLWGTTAQNWVQKCGRGVRSNFNQKYFLIKCKFFDVVFYADSEYHVYLVRKPIFNSQNLEIRVKFFNLLPSISK